MTKRRRSDADIFGDDPPPRRTAPNKGGRPIADHRQKLVLAQAELAQIKAAKMRGELVPAADVRATWASIVADARQRLLAVPSRIAGKAGLSREAVALVDREIRAALLALATQEGDADAADA